MVSDFFSRPGLEPWQPMNWSSGEGRFQPLLGRVDSGVKPTRERGPEELGIPVVINIPGYLEFIDDYVILRLASPEHSTACCGMICFGKRCKT